MLDVSHNLWLVAASLMVAMMAGFTGLSLTKGASELSIERRKVVITLAAISLGGGIWSMHFIAMLGMQLPIDFYYDPLITLASALVAILVVGLALLLLHFKTRNNTTLTASGTLIGIGILAMHYLGMSGIRGCLPVYFTPGVLLAVLVSIGLSIAAIFVAYGKRTHKNIILGTLFFGIAVFAVHFVAMAGTGFVVVGSVEDFSTRLGNENLAFIVTLGSFVICGAFLLNSVTFLPGKNEAVEGAIEIPEIISSVGAVSLHENTERAVEREGTKSARQVPFEKDGKTYFIDHDAIVAIRAEGHYTVLYSAEEKLFCPWSLSQAAKRLPSDLFIKCHRSYIINQTHVTSFERKKDNGVCYFEDASSLEKVPVSRTQLGAVRQRLGIG